MSISVENISARAAFDRLSETYDDTFTTSLAGAAQRQSVWREIDRVFKPGKRILEINCGTGVDALHLASRGVRVLACDASPGMVVQARRRLTISAFEILVQFRELAIEEIGELQGQEPFDGLLSNFAGLNCVRDLDRAAWDLARLVAPGGKAVLCLFGRFCAWETIWYLAQAKKGKAFRRFSPDGVDAELGGERVHVQYPSVGEIRRIFAPWFRLERWKGAGVLVPPSYLEFLARRAGRWFTAAAAADLLIGHCPGVRSLADHMVLTFERLKT